MKARIVAVTLLVFSARAWAADSGDPDLFVSGLKMVVGMAVVIGLMLLVYFMNKKGIGFLKRGGTSRINIVETRPVGGRKMLCLVEVDGQSLLLGIGNDRIDFLCNVGSSSKKKGFENSLQNCFQEKK